MIAHGRVKNGVVLLAEGIHLPEGQEVTVIVGPQEGASAHGILDIPPVRLGSAVRPLSAVDDLLAEMLEGRS